MAEVDFRHLQRRSLFKAGPNDVEHVQSVVVVDEDDSVKKVGVPEGHGQVVAEKDRFEAIRFPVSHQTRSYQQYKNGVGGEQRQQRSNGGHAGEGPDPGIAMFGPVPGEEVGEGRVSTSGL